MNIIFMGTPDFSVPVLEQLIRDGYHIQAVVTQPDRPKGRKKILTPPPVKTTAVNEGIPVLQPEKVRDPGVIQNILSYEPDVVITAAYGQILPESLLTTPPMGCINVHASLLPAYRGGAPIHQAIIDGKEETGVTLMYMVKALDAGDMLAQVSVPIDETDTVGDLHDKLSHAGAQLLSDTLPKIKQGDVTPVPQDEAAVTYAPNIKREDEVIDWHRPGQAIYDQVRGMNPFPVAYTKLNGRVLKIWVAEKVSCESASEPGTVIDIESDGFVVQTGDATGIKVTKCQPSGKKRMSAARFLNGTDLTKGTRLGES